MKRLLKTLMIAAAIVGISTTLYSNQIDYELDENLIEVGFLSDDREIEVNLMCKSGLRFEETYEYGELKTGYSVEIRCLPAEGTKVLHDGSTIESIEVSFDITNRGKAQQLEVILKIRELEEEVNGMVRAETTTKTLVLDAPHISLTTPMNCYLYEKDFSDLSFVFQYQ